MLYIYQHPVITYVSCIPWTCNRLVKNKKIKLLDFLWVLFQLTLYKVVGPNVNLTFGLLLSPWATVAYISCLVSPFSCSDNSPPELPVIVLNVSNHRKIYFHTRNKPNFGSIWSGLRPPLFIRPRFGCLAQTVVLGRFHTCDFGLDQMDKSESADQTSDYRCERDHWHTCHVYCSICHSIARKADGHQRSLQSCWSELFPFEINRLAMSSSTT